MFETIKQTLDAQQVTLVVVSKMQSNERIMDIYRQGQRIFGENRVQELVPKYETLPRDIQWHLIGHLQRNKVKYIAPFVQMIHSVDSIDLLSEINKQALKHQRTIDCLLQFHIATEESKFGLDLTEAITMLLSPQYRSFQNIRFCGVMGMATNTDNHAMVKQEFMYLKYIFDTLKTRYFKNQPHFKEISMGMSGDWELAVENGSTMVRLGSAIFDSEE